MGIYLPDILVHPHSSHLELVAGNKRITHVFSDKVPCLVMLRLHLGQVPYDGKSLAEVGSRYRVVAGRQYSACHLVLTDNKPVHVELSPYDTVFPQLEHRVPSSEQHADKGQVAVKFLRVFPRHGIQHGKPVTQASQSLYVIKLRPILGTVPDVVL